MFITELNHVQITVEPELEAKTIEFYRNIVRLREIEKPDELKKNGGAWFKIGGVELHVSKEPGPLRNSDSKRHVCYFTDDIDKAETHFRNSGVEILSDRQPIPEWVRFYVRDPSGNRLEIAQKRQLK